MAQKYLRKGSKIYIEGQLQTRKWTDQSGVEKYSTEVVLQRFRGELQMLDRAGEGGGGDYNQDSQSGGAPGSSDGGAPSGGNLDDDIPF